MIYEKIKQICKEKGVSVRSIEKEAGLSNGAISKWNEVTPKVDSIQAVAKALKVDIKKLLC